MPECTDCEARHQVLQDVLIVVSSPLPVSTIRTLVKRIAGVPFSSVPYADVERERCDDTVRRCVQGGTTIALAEAYFRLLRREAVLRIWQLECPEGGGHSVVTGLGLCCTKCGAVNPTELRSHAEVAALGEDIFADSD